MNRITKFAFVLFVFSLTVFFTHESLAVGFSKGNAFQTTPVSGSLFIQCPTQPGMPGGPVGPSTNFVNCSAVLWSPDIVDYFVGPQRIEANKVTLTATHQDGSRREKSSDYDSSKGISTSRFNLGISTLTQRPLLKLGLNKIHYVLSMNDQMVTQGDFDVTVTEQQELRCPSGSYYSADPFDCQGAGGYNACDRYFEQHNYCQ